MSTKHSQQHSVAFFIMVLAGLLSAGGCTVVGPDFCGVPVKSVSSNFLNSPSGDQWQSPNLPARPQWHRFQDQTLNNLIDNALVESPSVKELHWRICEAGAVVAVVSGQRQPFAIAGATYEKRKRSEQAQPFVGPNGDPFDFFSLGVNSQWEIDLVGRIRRETQAAQAEYQSTVADLHDARRLLVGEIARAFVRVRLYQALQHTSRANLEIQSTALDSVESRITAGKVGRLDLVQLQSRLRLTESDIPFFNEQLKIALNQLALLVGTTPNRQFLEFVGYGPQLNAPLIGRGVPADLIRHRPDMRRAEQEVAAETARVGVATAELYPKLSLLGTISVDSRNFGSLLSPESLAFTLGPSFAWNILSLGRIEKSIEAQKARVQQAIQRYQQTLLTAVGEVENSLASYHENTRRSGILLQAVEKAAEAVELAEDQYKADRASLERVVSNQRRLLQASILLAETRAAIATASVDLVQATGVGWGGPGSVVQNNFHPQMIVHGPHTGNENVPLPPGEVPKEVDPSASKKASEESPRSLNKPSDMDEPVEGDSDGKTELLPEPKRQSLHSLPQPGISMAPFEPATMPEFMPVRVPSIMSELPLSTEPVVDPLALPDELMPDSREANWQRFRPDPDHDWSVIHSAKVDSTN